MGVTKKTNQPSTTAHQCSWANSEATRRIEGAAKSPMHGQVFDWVLPVVLILAIATPILGTNLLNLLFSSWSWASLPFHSTVEVAGAALGLVLATLILFSRHKTPTSRRMWIASALTSMAILDIFHSCVPAGISFVWLHSLAVLAGGLFFALVWYPERELAPGTAPATAVTVLFVTLLIGLFSTRYPERLPAMVEAGQFTTTASAINFLGGGLTILAALNFGIRYHHERDMEELLFLILCLLFGLAGVIFSMSDIWHSGWWFWHLLRLCGYLLACWLALLTYRRAENRMIQAHRELDGLFHTSVDGKRLIDCDFNQLRINDTFMQMLGINAETALQMKCYEAFGGPLCHTEKCPITQFKNGPINIIQIETRKTRADGTEIDCILSATPLTGADGSYQGIIESFWDVTDRNLAEKALETHGAEQSARTSLSMAMQGNLNPEELCSRIITFLCKHLEVETGLIYLADEQGTLHLIGSYAHRHRMNLTAKFAPGEGLVGQAALEKQAITLSHVPEDSITIESGLVEALPSHIYVKPIILTGRTVAVIELGTLGTFRDAQEHFLDLVMESIGTAIKGAQARMRLATTLEESQSLSEELQDQQHELKSANEELQEQAQQLKSSEESLRAQQEEMEVTNEELKEKNKLLKQQTHEVDQARADIEEKATELAQASKYKSQFLANMSHELRSPLNSLLLLADSLKTNREGTLNDEQMESAAIIYDSGNELLSLINEILDLSKIEAGHMDLNLEEVRTSELSDNIRHSFDLLAREKGLDLVIRAEEAMAPHITTDQQRLEQIIKNLVSNAIKFTEHGQVCVTFGPVDSNVHFTLPNLSPGNAFRIAVTDTGIGLEIDKQKMIFEAFQQADGGTSRRYGGTGLGLAISRELALLLGGEIQLESEPGKGSTFTLYLPLSSSAVSKPISEGTKEELPPPPEPAVTRAGKLFNDDRNRLDDEKRTLLVIEDDKSFAAILYKLAHEHHFSCLVALTGEEGLKLARRHKPTAVTLDLHLPGVDGWSVLGKLKSNPSTRHIPVHIISVEEDDAETLRRGAIGHLTKPVNRESLEDVFDRIEEISDKKFKRLLVVEDKKTDRKAIIELLDGMDINIDQAKGGREAIAAIHAQKYDCIILDLNLGDMSGDEVLNKMAADQGSTLPPVIIYTACELSREHERALQEHASTIVLKDARSQERLLDEVSLFLHSVVSDMPAEKQRIISELNQGDDIFINRKILVVDDDMRTVFALTHLLNSHGMNTLKAENGKKALALLDQDPEIDLILTDIMMPEMDGYETIKRIRGQERFKKLPIIALTAKAMKKDKELCFEAGASDYLPKPVDQERLLSMLRVWLYR